MFYKSTFPHAHSPLLQRILQNKLPKLRSFVKCHTSAAPTAAGYSCRPQLIYRQKCKSNCCVKLFKTFSTPCSRCSFSLLCSIRIQQQVKRQVLFKYLIEFRVVHVLHLTLAHLAPEGLQGGVGEGDRNYCFMWAMMQLQQHYLLLELEKHFNWVDERGTSWVNLLRTWVDVLLC